MKQKPLIVGSILSAFLASSCCLAPLLFLVFGVSASSLSFLQVFAPYKWFFSLVSVVVLLYLWREYFKKRVVCSSSLCKNYKFYLIMGTLFVFIFISYPYWVGYILEYV